MRHSLEGFLEEVMGGPPAWSGRQMGWGGRMKGRNQPMPQAACALPGRAGAARGSGFELEKADCSTARQGAPGVRGRPQDRGGSYCMTVIVTLGPFLFFLPVTWTCDVPVSQALGPVSS